MGLCKCRTGIATLKGSHMRMIFQIQCQAQFQQRGIWLSHWAPITAFRPGRYPDTDCPAILKISRPGVPSLDAGKGGDVSIDFPFRRITEKQHTTDFSACTCITLLHQRAKGTFLRALFEGWCRDCSTFSVKYQ